MPPEPVVHKSAAASFVRVVSLLLVGIVLGAACALVGGYYVLASPAGDSLIRDYFVPRTNTSAIQAAAASSTAALEAASSTVLIVPKAYASEAYYVAINAVNNDVDQLDAVNISLAPVLAQLNSQALSCNFDGFYGVMTSAQNLVSKDGALATQFGTDLAAFSAANAETTDPTTKTDTDAAVAAGQQFQIQLESYSSGLAQILAGGVPTSAQVTGLYNQVTATHAASLQFSSAMQTLLEHFDTVQQ